MTRMSKKRTQLCMQLKKKVSNKMKTLTWTMRTLKSRNLRKQQKLAEVEDVEEIVGVVDAEGEEDQEVRALRTWSKAKIVFHLILYRIIPGSNNQHKRKWQCSGRTAEHLTKRRWSLMQIWLSKSSRVRSPRILARTSSPLKLRHSLVIMQCLSYRNPHQQRKLIRLHNI